MQQPYTTNEKIVSIHTKDFFSTHNHDVAMPLHLEGVERRVVGAGYEEYYPRRDFFQLFWSIAGSGEFLQEDGTRIPLEPGDVFWVQFPKVGHCAMG